MANVLFYSTGEIFWVTDPPAGKPHIGIPHVFPSVPPDHLFTYSMAAHAVESAGHTVVGAYGRQRQAVREAGGPDPEILALATIHDPSDTVVVLIATDSGSRAEGGVDQYSRIPFSQAERDAIDQFRSRGGGLYVTWDHGPLGYKTLQELGLEGPLLPEPDEPQRPNVEWSHDSTCEAKVRTDGFVKRADGTLEPADVWLSVGPPAGYLQKVVPAQILGPNPRTPHPIFNGVGGVDGIWIPAHMHEGKLKGKVSLRGVDETELPDGVKYLAVHVPFTETTFNSFAVMAYKDSVWDGEQVTGGRVIWDTSFHHLVDINWSSDGLVPWDPFVPFSAQALWKQQLPQELFEARMHRGMKRLWVNAVKWLVHGLPPAPTVQVAEVASRDGDGTAFTPSNASSGIFDQVSEYPEPADLLH